MTKPITSLAIMMLFEQGKLKLKDPVSKYIPAFANTQVYRSGSALTPSTEGLKHPMLLWHLLTHTSGLSYGFLHAHPVDAMYRAKGYEWAWPNGATLEQACEHWASLPLLYQPGTEWNYSVATDVLGRIVEVVSGQSLADFFKECIFEPLGMQDTGFFVAESEQHRLAALYAANPANNHLPVRFDSMGQAALSEPSLYSGGGGLISTAKDYHLFSQMLLGQGALNQTRLISPRTFRYMTENHLPGGAELSQFGRPLFAETDFDGMGFGLGFAVVCDHRATKNLCSNGEISWGGAASTSFLIDQSEQISAQFYTQLVPSSTWPLRAELRQLIYQALMD